MSAAETYAARVDAVLEQRTRLRGPQPPGDLFAGLPPGHPLLTADPRRSLDPNLEIIASYLEPNDVIVDVGGGAGRQSLPLALRCREVVNVDPSAAMLAAFEAAARQADITNARTVHADWLDIEPPPMGSFALVNNVTYLTREIVAFVEKLERAASRRVLITVASPPPPARNRVLFQLIHGEESQRVPGHVELVNVLWELGIEPDVRMLSERWTSPASPDREHAIQAALTSVRGHQWAFWPWKPDVGERARQLLESRFDGLFAETPDGYMPRWAETAREVLITWEPRR